jgi:hypothetical protein
LQRICESGSIFNAWSDEPWINDGAAVRVSLVCFGSVGAGLKPAPTKRDTASEGRLRSTPTPGADDGTCDE